MKVDGLLYNDELKSSVVIAEADKELTLSSVIKIFFILNRSLCCMMPITKYSIYQFVFQLVDSYFVEH